MWFFCRRGMFADIILCDFLQRCNFSDRIVMRILSSTIFITWMEIYIYQNITIISHNWYCIVNVNNDQFKFAGKYLNIKLQNHVMLWQMQMCLLQKLWNTHCLFQNKKSQLFTPTSIVLYNWQHICWVEVLFEWFK